MATNRTPINRPHHVRLTPEIIAAYRDVLRLTDGEDRDALIDAKTRLHMLLGRAPWQECVMCVEEGYYDDWNEEVRDEAGAHRIRAALRAATKGE